VPDAVAVREDKNRSGATAERPDVAMEHDELMGAVMRLNAATEALAAVGAHLRAGLEPELTLHPSIAARVEAVSAVACGGDATEVPEPARAVIVSAIRTFFLQAADLLEHPERAPGWVDPDPRLLQSQGRGSAAVLEVIARIPEAAVLLGRPGAGFLDVGTGAGWIAIAAARRFPQLRVVGIDRFDPALALADANVRETGCLDRVEIRRQDLSTLADRDTFDLVWLPGPFLARDALVSALPAVRSALRPGGALAVGLYGGPPEPLAQALTDLRTVRGGGHPWDGPDLVAVLASAGFEGVREIERTWHAPVRLVLANRP
jgi:precorrin-6B methylase 2